MFLMFFDKNRSKTTSLLPNLGAAASLKSKAYCSLRVMTPGRDILLVRLYTKIF